MKPSERIKEAILNSIVMRDGSVMGNPTNAPMLHDVRREMDLLHDRIEALEGFQLKESDFDKWTEAIVKRMSEKVEPKQEPECEHINGQFWDHLKSKMMCKKSLVPDSPYRPKQENKKLTIKLKKIVEDYIDVRGINYEPLAEEVIEAVEKKAKEFLDSELARCLCEYLRKELL